MSPTSRVGTPTVRDEVVLETIPLSPRVCRLPGRECPE